MRKIVFIAKTDINTDGRILNQLNLLKENFDKIKIDFVLFPDKEVIIDIGSWVNLHQIKTSFRNNKLLRFLTVFDFTIKSFKLLRKLKPEVIHAQDSAIILPVLLYKFFTNKKFYLIYDDHELPNENEAFTKRVFDFFENIVIKNADTVIFANQERLVFLKQKLNLKNELFYFLNLPYNSDQINLEIPLDLKNSLQTIQDQKEESMQFIIHQGPIKIERGRAKIAAFIKLLPKGYKLLLVGGTKIDFERFKLEYKLDDNKFHFIGRVNYQFLGLFWDKAFASLIMYLPTYLNNRLCAPNRLYLSYFKGLPAIVNKDNPVLSNFVESFNAGDFVENFLDKPNEIFLVNLLSEKNIEQNKTNLINFETRKLTKLYNKFFSI